MCLVLREAATSDNDQVSFRALVGISWITGNSCSLFTVLYIEGLQELQSSLVYRDSRTEGDKTYLLPNAASLGLGSSRSFEAISKGIRRGLRWMVVFVCNTDQTELSIAHVTDVGYVGSNDFLRRYRASKLEAMIARNIVVNNSSPNSG